MNPLEQTQAPFPAPTPPTTIAPQQPVRQKDYLVAVLLSFFVGMYGVDRFYLGKIPTGILKLLTLGGFCVWYLIDMIRITYGKTKDAKGNPLKGVDQPHPVARALITLYVVFQIVGGSLIIGGLLFFTLQ